MSLSIIVQTVKGHLEDLICLTQAIPGTVVTLVHFNGMPDGQSTGKNKETLTTIQAAVNPSSCFELTCRPGWQPKCSSSPCTRGP